MMYDYSDSEGESEHSRRPSAGSNCERSDSESNDFLALHEMVLENKAFLLAAIEVAVQNSYDDWMGKALTALSLRAGDYSLQFYCVNIETGKDDGAEMVLRGPQLCSTVVSETFILEGLQFMTQKLVPALKTIISNSSTQNFEIQRDRILKTNGGNVEKTMDDIKTNCKHVVEAIRLILDALWKPDMPFPRNLVALTKYIHEKLLVTHQNAAILCARIFLFLRFINPIIALPDKYGLVPSSEISISVRRNLAMIAKVIQACSNGTSNKLDDGQEGLEELVAFSKEQTVKMDLFVKSILNSPSQPICKRRAKISFAPGMMSERMNNIEKFFKDYRTDIRSMVESMKTNDNLPCLEKFAVSQKELTEYAERTNKLEAKSIQEQAKSFLEWETTYNFMPIVLAPSEKSSASPTLQRKSSIGNPFKSKSNSSTDAAARSRSADKAASTGGCFVFRRRSRLQDST